MGESSDLSQHHFRRNLTGYYWNLQFVVARVSQSSERVCNWSCFGVVLNTGLNNTLDLSKLEFVVLGNGVAAANGFL